MTREPWVSYSQRFSPILTTNRCIRMPQPFLFMFSILETRSQQLSTDYLLCHRRSGVDHFRSQEDLAGGTHGLLRQAPRCAGYNGVDPYDPQGWANLGNLLTNAKKATVSVLYWYEKLSSLLTEIFKLIRKRIKTPFLCMWYCRPCSLGPCPSPSSRLLPPPWFVHPNLGDLLP